jgi:hypothetical protein
MTDVQFHHNSQMHALAPFKAAVWNLPTDVKEQLMEAWEAQFDKLFNKLGCAGTRPIVEQFIHPVKIQPKLEDYLSYQSIGQTIRGLAG